MTGLLILGWGAWRAYALTPDEQNTIAVYQRVADSVGLVLCRSVDSDGQDYVSTGSGFFIDEQLVVTNFHVVREAEQVSFAGQSAQTVGATVVGTAPSLDIALLRVELPQPHPAVVTIGDAVGLRVGQTVFAVGSAYGFGNSMTAGIISGLERELSVSEFGTGLIQFDASVNPGQSGGPLVDSGGRVVGVIVAKIENGEAVGFAVPIDAVAAVVPDLVEFGHTYSAKIGIHGSDIGPRLSALFGLAEGAGFLIEGVEDGSPAHRAGLLMGARQVEFGDRIFVLGGDVIVAAGGRRVAGGGDLARILRTARPGEELSLRVVREGVEVVVVVSIPPARDRP